MQGESLFKICYRSFLPCYILMFLCNICFRSCYIRGNLRKEEGFWALGDMGIFEQKETLNYDLY